MFSLKRAKLVDPTPFLDRTDFVNLQEIRFEYFKILQIKLARGTERSFKPTPDQKSVTMFEINNPKKRKKGRSKKKNSILLTAETDSSNYPTIIIS